jgi:carbon starvation protein
MPLPALALIVVAALVAGYTLYSRLLARLFDLDDAVKTPAHVHADGVDFQPTAAPYLLGQHFSAIAAAGPIVGPILACGQFGWAPCVLWIALGCVLIGAVHDMSALVASVRHGARTVAEVVRIHLSPRAWACFMAFIWLALLYVIVAFADVTAGTFLGRIEELEGVGKVAFERGGAVAFSSIAYLTLALVMGVVQKKLAPPLWVVTAIFVPATLGVIWLGTNADVSKLLAVAPGGAVPPQKLWGALILVYCFVASLLPVWLLMQPRGYLGGFVLYGVLAVGVTGVLFGGFEVAQPAFKGLVQLNEQGQPASATAYLFPFLFVTIACGACSGFHGLVCSGTTSKQVDKESHCRSVGYGGMLLEGLVALIALATVMIAAKLGKPPGQVYAEGIGRFVGSIFGKDLILFGTIFGAMAFSTFVFDTLDVATRLGRYILQELFGWRSPAAATAATLAVPMLFVLTAEPPGPGKLPAYMAYWTLFGASNQLLAALTLLGVTVWLKRTGRAFWFALAPTLFVMTITVWALAQIAWSGLATFLGDAGFALAPLVNGVVSVTLLLLAGLLVIEALRAVGRPLELKVPPATADHQGA